MTKWILMAALIMASPLSPAAEKTKAPAEGADPAAAGKPLNYSVIFHGGFLFDSGDPEVNSKWTHDPLYSYMAQLGFRYNMHFLIPGFYMMAGPDIAYMVNEEEHSSSQAASYLTSKYIQLFATIGAGFQPITLGGVGFEALFSYEVWGQKTSKFDGHGMSKDLGTEKSDIEMAFGFNVFYAVTPQWKPYLGYLRNQGNAAVAGVTFAF